MLTLMPRSAARIVARIPQWANHGGSPGVERAIRTLLLDRGIKEDGEDLSLPGL